MFQSAYFISDLHLNADDTRTQAAFLHFLAHTAPHAEALYILGDLFDFWIGDDDLLTPLNQQVVQAFSKLHARGIQIFYMHGNRDFLAGKRFAYASQLHLLPDPTTVIVGGQTLLLTHGDLLCTEDQSYLKLRAVVHNPFVQYAFLALPKRWRRNIARHIQQTARRQATPKQLSLMDVNEEMVAVWLQKYHATLMIHGHTHQPAQHIYPNGTTRWVLPDWKQGDGGYLFIDGNGISLCNLTGAPFHLKPNYFIRLLANK